VNQSHYLEEHCSNPYALCGYSAVNMGVKWARNKQAKIRFIFEGGDKGAGQLNTMCQRTFGVEPLFLSKTEAVPCQAADLLAWKHRIAITNIKEMELNNPEEANLIKRMEELGSVMNVLVRPGTSGIYTREALLRTCARSNILKRGTIKI